MREKRTKTAASTRIVRYFELTYERGHDQDSSQDQIVWYDKIT